MDTLENRDHRTAGPPVPAGSQARLCPLCDTLNHQLSRECFNCGWRDAFPGGDAGADRVGLRAGAEAPPMRLWWQRLRTWFHPIKNR